MPARSQIRIRRDLNRLNELVAQHAATQPALAAVRGPVEAVTAEVNRCFQAYQQTAVAADRERTERDQAVANLRNWVQQWRPVVLMMVPGASANLRQLPSSGATLDDQIRVAEDLRNLLAASPGAASFRDAALAALGDQIDVVQKEYGEAATALPAEAGARAALTETTLAGNEVLVRSLDIVRAVFGSKSPEYKQFVVRSTSPADADEEDREAAAGEGNPAPGDRANP